MFRRIFAAIAITACAGCGDARDTAAGSLCDADVGTAIEAMVAAHGGMEAWQQLTSIYVEREHLFAGSEQPIRFNIHGEYPSHRIYQEWQAPAGKLAWDGEHAWSQSWPLAAQLMPRYVAGIGFYLVNMPWLAHRDAAKLGSQGCSGNLPGQGDKRFLVITADYEPDPVRKPDWYAGPRGSYDLYIDPDTHRLQGLLQHWAYAGRLDTAGEPVSATAISQLVVPDTFVEVNGLIWPHTYKAYTTEHEIAAEGRFFDYAFSKPFDERLLFPDPSMPVDWDTSSSYQRRAE